MNCGDLESALRGNACRELIAKALEEDIGTGDLSGLWFVPGDSRSRALLVARGTGCLAGADVAAEVFRCVDPGIAITIRGKDGDVLQPGARVLELHGSTRSLLAAERTALNFIQHLSGIATLTRQFVDAIAGTRAGILDTRKTLPGWRTLQKAAVLAGGGKNHRMGLHDMVMLKDNHLAAIGGTASFLTAAITAFHTAHPDIRVEVEADTVEQVREFLPVKGIAVILLDNMSIDELRTSVALRDTLAPGVLLEASGGISLATARDIASTGVDFLSVGALTHSAPALDLALDFL